VPAEPSSSIPPGLGALAQADPLRPAETPHLLAYLARVPDPRRRAGRRHPLVATIALAAAAVETGARSLAAIAEWAADTDQAVRAALGTWQDPLTGHRRVPTETTIRRTLARLEPDAVAAVIGAWLVDRDDPGQRRRAVAVDGKTLRGARRDHGGQVHLLAVMDHTTRVVLAQCEVNGAPGEAPAFKPVLSGLDLAGVVVTADALQTHAAAAEFLVTGKQAHYLFTVKAKGANPPGPVRPAALAPRARAGPHPRPRARPRRAADLKAVTVNNFGFSHAAQVVQVTRKVRDLRAAAGGP
jgi:hypothetical protein